jgi:hypothetical protein
MPVPPRILLVMGDQWPRALLRAALREAGYDAVGTRTAAGAARQLAPAAGRGPVALVLVDHDAAGADPGTILALESTPGAPPMVLVAQATREPPAGPWKRTVRRPVSVGELVDLVRSLVPLPKQLRHPIDPVRG